MRDCFNRLEDSSDCSVGFNETLTTGSTICQTICFALDAWQWNYMDQYVKKIITASRNHLKPIQGGTIRKEGI